jgi:outer membrane immunogenic protein
MRFRNLALAAAATVAMSTAAQATDLYTAVEPAPATMDYDDGFDWQGIYVGAFAGVFHLPQGLGFGDVAVGKVVGVNLELGEHFLLGVEGRGFANLNAGGFNYWTVEGVGRAGIVLAEDWLVYAAGGAAYSEFGGGAWLLESVIGGGVEYAVSDDLSVRGEVTHRECVDGFGVACLVGGTNLITGAVLWHFN